MKARRREPPDLLRHAAATLAPCDPAEPQLIGVSGGRDSIALLHALCARGFRRLIVCHLDHALRPGSDDDARFVAAVAKSWGCECEVGREKVAARAKRRKESLETAARNARYAFFAKIARQHECPRIFLAHHADDQVETFLFNLLRGTGGTGLGAMRPIAQSREGLELVRPLLAVWREEIDAYMSAHRLEFREDATNLDPGFTRNRLRHEILPTLSAALGRDVRRALWRTAEILREEDELLASAPELQSIPGELRTRDVAALPIALQRRLLLRWLKAGGVNEIGFEEVEAVREMLSVNARAKVNLPGARHARRNRGRIFLTAADGGSHA